MNKYISIFFYLSSLLYQSNITNTAFWLTIYTINNKEVFRKVTEIIENNYDSDIEDFNWTELYSNQYLDSLIKETMRMNSNVTSAREVLDNTTVTIAGNQEYSLKKGEMVIIPINLVHWNESVYPDPMTWKPDRFLKTETSQGGLNMAQPDWKSYVPWGGGKHMCAGRFFAKNEMIIQLVYTLWYYDISFLEPIPKPYIKERFGTGSAHPDRKLQAKIKRKRGLLPTDINI